MNKKRTGHIFCYFKHNTNNNKTTQLNSPNTVLYSIVEWPVQLTGHWYLTSNISGASQQYITMRL